MSALGQALKARRTALGFSLRDVEEITEGQVSNAYLCQLENGKIASPSLKICIALAATYALSATTMFDWAKVAEDEITPPTLCPTCGRAITGDRPS